MKTLIALFESFIWRTYRVLKCTSVLLFFALLFSGCTSKEKSDVSRKNLHQCKISIKTFDNRHISFTVEIAEKDEDRQKGLMFRKSLPENNGMLFIFPKEIPLVFWMKNTYIPLDIAYIGKNYIIHSIQYKKPLDISVTYPSGKPAKYALEMNAAWFKKNTIKPGDILNLNGCIGQ